MRQLHDPEFGFYKLRLEVTLTSKSRPSFPHNDQDRLWQYPNLQVIVKKQMADPDKKQLRPFLSVVSFEGLASLFEIFQMLSSK
jgi:hypothetical protein